MVSILIAEDQPHFRQGIHSLIQHQLPAWNVVGETDNGDDAWVQIVQSMPDIVLLDIHMPGLSGIQVAERIYLNKIDTVLIIITGYQNFQYAQAAVRFGAFDYLLKPCSDEDLITVLGKAYEKIQEKLELSNQLKIADKYRWVDSTERQTGYNNMIEKVTDYINENYMYDCSVSVLAAHVHLNPTYLSTVFKKKNGESLTTYVTRIRMEKAMYLLRNTDWKVTEIANSTGFDEPTYFTNVFRKFSGMSPSEFRNRP